MLRYLIWDVDGTLFDTYPAIVEAFDRTVRDFDVLVSRARLRRLANVSFSHCAQTIAAEFGLEADVIRARFLEHSKMLPLEPQVPFPGVVEVCEYILASGGKNCILTHRGRDSLLALLNTHGIASLFADIVAGDDGFPRKPDPVAIEALIERQGLIREQTLMIGDRDLDVLAGQAADVHTCFFGQNPHAAVVDVAVTEYVALLAWLKRGHEVREGE